MNVYTYKFNIINENFMFTIITCVRISVNCMFTSVNCMFTCANVMFTCLNCISTSVTCIFTSVNCIFTRVNCIFSSEIDNITSVKVMFGSVNNPVISVTFAERIKLFFGCSSIYGILNLGS